MPDQPMLILKIGLVPDRVRPAQTVMLMVPA